jgi:hypothetical protein
MLLIEKVELFEEGQVTISVYSIAPKPVVVSLHS